MPATRTLNVGPNIRLPVDAVTQSFGILAKRGAGKSNAAVAFAEEMYRAGLPWVAIDPKGDWWGIRAGADGNTPGLAIPVFGGLHDDLPLTPDSGAVVADLIVERNLTCVLDVSEMTEGEQTRFLIAFGDRLYKLHGADPQPRHLFLEEADNYIPQGGFTGNMARCVGTYTKLVKMGRSRGLGVTLITQRSAVINKNALTQIDTLIALRTTAPQDRKAIRDWIDHNDADRHIADSLPQLADGEAWLMSPHWLKRVERVQFRRRHTFDSGATPTIGEARPSPRLADVDLAAIKEQLADVVEKAADDDPRILRRRVTDLERRLAANRADPVEVRVEVPVVPLNVARCANLAVHQLRKIAEGLAHAGIQPGAVLEIAQGLAGALSAAGHLRPDAFTLDTPATTPAPPQRPAPPRRPSAAAVPPPTPPRRPTATGDGEEAKLGRAERALLTVLAQHPDGCTRTRLAFLAGYSPKSSSIGNALGVLRGAGYVNRDTPIAITDTGREALGEWEPFPAGPALVAHWTSRLGKAEAQVLTHMLDVWPNEVTRDELAAATGYSAKSSSLGNALGRLRSLELIRGWVADDTLAQAHTEG